MTQIIAKEGHSGGIVVFPITDKLANKMYIDELPGTISMDEYHITLAYVKFNNMQTSVWSDIVKESIFEIGCPPNNISIDPFLSRFIKVAGTYDDAIVYNVYVSDEMYQWRQDLIKNLEHKGMEVALKKQFNPHVTIAYVRTGYYIPSNFTLRLDEDNPYSNDISLEKLEIWYNEYKEEVINFFAANK